LADRALLFVYTCRKHFEYQHSRDSASTNLAIKTFENEAVCFFLDSGLDWQFIPSRWFNDKTQVHTCKPNMNRKHNFESWTRLLAFSKFHIVDLFLTSTDVPSIFLLETK